MKKIISGSIFLLLFSPAFSQNVMVLQDPISSKVFSSERYSDVRGTPFLFEKWMKGTVTTPRGIYNDLEIKFNVYDNALFFSRDDNAYEFTDNITSFTLMPKPDDKSSYLVYKKGITGPDFKPTEFVRVLAEGNGASAYKLDQKYFSEKSEINAGIVKTFAHNSKYYIQVNKNISFVKLNKAEILNVLKDKEDKLNTYISEKKLNFKKDTDLIELVNYYNTL
jgi:hypothetical protein